MHFNIDRRIKEEWREDCIMTNAKPFNWDKYGAKKAVVHRGGGKLDVSYILHSLSTKNSREQFIITFNEDDSNEIIETIGHMVDIGTTTRLNEFVIIIAAGDSLKISKSSHKTKRYSISANAIKQEIKENIGTDFIHYDIKLERIVGEQAFILHPIEKTS